MDRSLSDSSFKHGELNPRGKHLRGVFAGQTARWSTKFIGVGDDGMLALSFNGTNWLTRSFTSKHLRAVSRSPNGVTIIVGDDGFIARRKPGVGASESIAAWDYLTGLTTKNLHGVSAWDDAHWVIVGDDGVILRSNDGGTTWFKAQRGSKNLYAVA